MPPLDPLTPQETPQDLIEIPDGDAITVDEAITIAGEMTFSLGKSTLQRWAKHWREKPGGAVRCVLVTTTSGKIYKLSRDDFRAWIFDQQQNQKPHEIPQDLSRPHEVLRDPARSRETSPEEHHLPNHIKELESEIMNLKIDLGVRKQLLDRVKEEIDDLRSMNHSLLRENGALEYQLLQLPPAPKREVAPSTPAPHTSQSYPNAASIDMQPETHPPAVDKQLGL